jgi:hypothetical protein
VWSVRKCQQLLGQMLQRAPGAKFPPIYKDLELMQVNFTSNTHAVNYSVEYQALLLGTSSVFWSVVRECQQPSVPYHPVPCCLTAQLTVRHRHASF